MDFAATGTTILRKLFEAQLAHQPEIARRSVSQRKKQLSALQAALLSSRQEIRDAMYRDFRKPEAETDLTEILPVISGIRHIRSNLSRWMKHQSVPTPLALLGASSWIEHEPKGVVLIISPWNFPLTLTFAPLAAAIAAGNCAILKPSENTPHISAVMKRIIGQVFPPEEVVLVEGDKSVASELLDLPFHHIFFTGSPQVGKIVMEKAARHLASVTLELGGKSPAIIDRSANLEQAARRMAWAKFLNNGQVCIAPDYLFVHREVADPFLEKLKQQIDRQYGADASESDSYARIVNHSHFQRLEGYLEDALKAGGNLLKGGEYQKADNYLAPTLVQDVPRGSGLLEEEIFGPILPVMTFEELEEPIRFIEAREKPLSLYIYSTDKQTIRTLIERTRAGGTVINHSIIHYFNPYLPFGGVNGSGIGKSNGFYAFRAFSNQRAVMRQWSPLGVSDLVAPPFRSWKKKVIDLAIKYL